METLILAEGAILERVLQTGHTAASEDLSRHAYGQLDAALMRTAWGRRHRRRFALMEGDDVLASALQYDLAAVLDHQPVRICGIGSIVSKTGDEKRMYAQSLVERLLQQAALDGMAAAVIFCRGTAPSHSEGFQRVLTTDVALTVEESSRHGAPMTLIRGGEERDLAAIVAMGRARAGPFRFHLDRDVDLVQHAITRKRLTAGLGQAGARQLQFFIAEEGITAAAYVVISVVGGTWTIEECGDRDPSGARVGAILQALIAREPGERRPAIRAWLPPGFVPPQVRIASANPSSAMMLVKPLPGARALPLTGEDVLYWRSDVF